MTPTQDVVALYGLYGDYPPYRDFPWFVFFLLFFLFSFLFWLFRKRPEVIKNIIFTKPNADPWQEVIAIFSLPKGDIRKFYFFSSEKLKALLGFAENTTREIKKDKSLTKYLKKEKLLDILEHSDLVKFAKYQPSQDEVKKYCADALDFLLANRPEKKDDKLL